MKIKIFLCALAMSLNLVASTPMNLLFVDQPKTFLLSYPRSGNSWLRYCIEYLTERPTCGILYSNPTMLGNPANLPLARMAGFSVDYTKTPIWKFHRKKEMNFLNYFNPQEEYLILILRNPKEAITRHERKVPDKKSLLKDSFSYFENLTVYDEWNPEKRLLLLYEDLIKDPRKTLEKLFTFIQESPVRSLDTFFEQYEEHKKKSLELYSDNMDGVSESQGKDTLHHSKKLTSAQRKNIDELIEELYPHLWHTYLKYWYAEEQLTL